MVRNILVSLMASVSVAAFVTAARADQFVNGNFEDGTLNGWTQGGGSWYGGSYPDPADYLPGGSLYVMGSEKNTVTNIGTDPNTDNTLNTVYAGSHSVQVNNAVSDYSVSVISQRVDNYTDSRIAFAYSAVLLDSHGPTDSDAFIITLTDATTNEVVYTYNLNSATAPGVFVRSTSGWYYTNWVTEDIDVSSRSGHDFILSLLANDCPYGAHAGYAYLDGFGGVVPPPGGGGGTGGTWWDGAGVVNGKVDGGDGVWDASAANWTPSDGSSDGAYTPNPGRPNFAGAPGTVRVDNSLGQIGILGASFLTSGYTITGDPIELAGTVATIDVGDGTSAGASFVATIDAPLFGSAGLTKGDLGTLILNGVNTYTGTTTVDAGTLVGSATSFGTGAIYANAHLVVDQPTDAVLANTLGGAGTFTKAGAGVLTLTANSPFAGATSVAAGTLRVDGHLDGSAVTVADGATLGGNGSVGSVEALAGATIAPGSSLGTLTVAGDYHQAAGSTYQVELESTGANDKLMIGGTATLDDGAVLNVTKLDAARYQLDHRYTVLTADGGRNGGYVLTGDTNVSLFYDLVASYDPNNVYLDVAQTHSFDSVAWTRNQKAAAGGADSLKSGPLFTSIAYLTSPTEARHAFDAISGEAYASSRSVMLEDSRFVREAVLKRLDTARSDLALGTGIVSKDDPSFVASGAFWGQAFGSWGRFDSDGNAASVKRDIGGFFVGLDGLVADQYRVGLVGGYSRTTFDIDNRASSGDIDSYHLGAYAGTEWGPLGVKVGGAYTWHDVSVSRNPAFTGFQDHLNGSYDAGTAQVFADIGYRFNLGDAALEPFVNLAYVNLHGDGFRETGGAAALTGSSGNQDITYSTLGLRASQTFNLGSAVLTARGTLGWKIAGGDVTPKQNLAFAGGTVFGVAGVPIARNALVAEAGLDLALSQEWTANVSYGGQFGDGFQDQSVKGTFTFKF